MNTSDYAFYGGIYHDIDAKFVGYSITCILRSILMVLTQPSIFGMSSYLVHMCELNGHRISLMSSTLN